MVDSPTNSPDYATIFAEDLLDGTEEVTSGSLDRVAVFDEETAGGTHLDRGDLPVRFDGDTSQLPSEVCWALQELLVSPHVTEKSKRHWPVVLQYEEILRSRLAELGLILVINREYRYAFTRQADDPSPHSRAVLRAKTLSLAASALALYLYNQYVVAPDDPIVERADMVDHMLAYKPASDTDDVGFRKKIDAAIKSLEDAAIIKPIRGNNDRYTVYGVITAILTADQVTALDARYQAVARGEHLHAVATDEEDRP
jgi:hypothetical protein